MDGPSSIVWPLELAGVFSVRSYRAALSGQRFPGSNHFPHDTVWSNIVPSKIQNFIWMVFHGKIATIDNLQRRGFHMVGRCVMCNRHYELVDHLFLGCDFSGTIWNRLSSALSLIGPFHDDVVSFLLAWKGMNCMLISRVSWRCCYMLRFGVFGRSGTIVSLERSLDRRSKFCTRFVVWLVVGCMFGADGQARWFQICIVLFSTMVRV